MSATEKSNWKALPSAPAGTTAPSFSFKGQSPAARWIYTNAQGEIAGIVCRFDLADGKSERITLAWCEDQFGKAAFKPRAMIDPRPIFGLARLTESPDTFAIVAGSEEAADAIAAAGMPSTTFAGGPGAVMKSDLSPLAGIVVILWASDESKTDLVAALAPVACELRAVRIPEGKPNGWNATAADCEEIAAAIRNAIVIEPPVDEQPEAEQQAQELVYYDGGRFLLDNGKDFVPMDGRSIGKQLKMRGVDEVDNVICRIQTDCYVKYFGPIAGKRRGVYESNGDLLLASSNPRIIASKPGAFPAISEFVKVLFGGDEHAGTQIESFLGWMKSARLAMLEGKRRPGQALVLAGPVACGKTQLIKQIITPSMGGREAKPYRYLLGKTGFNADLLGAEVLVIDDEAGSTRIESRRALGDGIKSSLFASSVRIEGKFKTGFDFAPLWRIVIAVNDQPESLMVLPPMSKDLADKIMIFKCQKALELSDHEFETWQAAIASELPAFLHYVERFEIKPENADGRCGVRCFTHPAVVDAVSELSPEHQLRALIDALEASGGIALPWEGTAAGLKALLCAHTAATRSDAERLLGSWPAACGVYLARLTGKGIEKLKLRDGDQRWRVWKSGEVDTKEN